jgi:hypothetical protein
MNNEINQIKLDAMLKQRELKEKFGDGAIVLVEFHLTELMVLFERFKPYRTHVRDIITDKLNFWLEVKHAIEKDATTLSAGHA